ncbi:Gfo/Idh/MocA family protein [Bacillus suaedae]|uniref:Gfo/Idh/MocA family oxidoreductase n=1 Tax=Halalkalibacter suaedae TaxID=2822140 RepID=A0A940X084_9BACI|nr:Gfo/Idh/MocA family oxidoreductase [Bacillus suaedae]MBP3952440.1 Gfo/Idh/MocA family oxidoreductase [Bacillus suaedae]
MTVIRVGIVGLGVVGQRLVKAFTEDDKFEIEAVCDVNAALLEETSAACNARGYTNYQELIADAAVDLVYVAVPPAYHHPVVIETIKQKKHLLCEKPLANSVEEAKDMYEKAKEAGIVHAIHFPLPYQAEFEQIKEWVNVGAFGEIRRIELSMQFDQWPRPWQQTPWIGTRKQGGFIREIMPHYIQMLIHLFGEVDETVMDVEFPQADEDSEIGLMARLKLKNGINVLVDGLVGQAEQEHIAFTIHGTEQSISLENWRVLKKAERGQALNELEPKQATTSLLNELHKAINGEEAFIIDFHEGLLVQELIDEAHK